MTRRAARQTLKPLLAATAMAILWAIPGLVIAQDTTPNAGQACVQNVDDGSCLPTAPNSARVDLVPPVFSHPTTITNPLYPISDLHSVLMLGHVDGQVFRSEVTLLPETRIIDVNGQQIEALVSQYVAYLDGRIQEVAIDWYAQADDGSVWYLGEDVADYEDGAIISTDGTWLAGQDGPPAMIMPANPEIGVVYRVEDSPPAAFEEVTVIRVDQTIRGPHGQVDGAIVVSELHQDGTSEEKVLAPGYGEFRTGGDGDLEALALAVPTDGLTESTPAELTTLLTGATELFDAARTGDWAGASMLVAKVNGVWDDYQAGEVPPLLDARMGVVLVELGGAVDAQSPIETQQGAIEVARTSLDLQLQYRPVPEIDLTRMELMGRQILVDVAADNSGGVTADVTTIEIIRDRVTAAIDQGELAAIDARLGVLRTAADGDDLDAAAVAAGQLLDLIHTLAPTS